MVGIRKQPFSAIADDQIAGLNGKSKACPFCGRHQASDKKGVLDTIEVADGRFAVACSCGASGPAETSRQKAGRAWNLRVHSDKSVCYDSHPHLPNMAPGQLRGNLKSVSFSAILQLLSSERKSGILHCVVKEKRTGIYLKDGRIVAASCTEGPHLGQILQHKGFISHDALRQSLVLGSTTGKFLGETLLSLKHVSHEQLWEALQFQVREVVMDVIFRQEGEFLYLDCTVEFDPRVFGGIKAVALLLEAAAVMDEAHAA